MGEFEDRVEEIADAGLLTERQAVAYLGREVDHTSRQQIASYLDCAPNTVDNHRARAVELVEAAEETLELITDYEEGRYPDPADECGDCGSTLAGSYVREAGRPLCWDCADVDRTDVEF
jgi:DNA-binding CsgD family transcriptional regulator